MLPRWLCLPLLVAALLAGSGAVRADDRGLEAWQERILRALEQGRDERPARAEGRGRDREDTMPPRQSLVGPSAGDPRARAAATEAQRRYGGRALAVIRAGDGYRVRLLGEDGRVTTVTIGD